MKRGMKRGLIVTVEDEDEAALDEPDLELERFAEPLAFEEGLIDRARPRAFEEGLIDRAQPLQDEVKDSAQLQDGRQEEERGFVLDRAVAAARRRLGLSGAPEAERVRASETGLQEEEVEARIDEDLDAIAPEGFFERTSATSATSSSFSSLGLSRALLRTLTTIGWSRPTPVQNAVIPPALEGRDMCVSAVTGSGKTGAFALPALERLMLRPKGSQAAIRVVVLVPTRELAEQCESVFAQLCVGTGLRHVCAVGGASVRTQESLLRERPDIVVATPGRLVDLLLNSADVGLEDVEMLVLDEADRLLDMGFIDQITEIVANHCPRKRQTLLFSATMTEDVKKLAALSLQRPLRVAMPSADLVVSGLRQEFVRVREEHEDKVLAMALVILLGPLRGKKTLIFVGRKVAAHRVALVLSLAGLECGELHGGLTQSVRSTAMSRFRNGSPSLLVATDVAARGLDTHVDAVLNIDMPLSIKEYVHRVGRTARAGRTGLAISLVKEQDRSLVKAIVKEGISDAARLQLPMDRVRFWHDSIASWQGEISLILEEEKMDKEARDGLRDVTRATNLIEHRDEILSRPKKEWFMTAEQKSALQEKNDAIEAKKREKQLKKKLKKQEEKQKNSTKEGWIPEEQMSKIREERRKRAREQAEEAAARAEKLRSASLLEFRDEPDEKRAKIKKQLANAAKTAATTSSSAKRALVAQQMRYKDEEKSKNAHRHERKEAHKKGFKSLSKYKRRR